MIYPKQFALHSLLLTIYLKYAFKKHFSEIRIIGEVSPDASKSTLLIGNHSTWWDGFFGWHLNQVLFKKYYYVMMLEEQLRKFWFFRYVGAFSVKPGAKNAIQSIHVASDLLKKPSTLLQFFPQGKFYSIYETQAPFYSGIERLTKDSPCTQPVFYAFFIEYGHKPKPTAYLYLQTYESAIGLTAKEWESAYSKYMQDTLKLHKLNFLKTV